MKFSEIKFVRNVLWNVKECINSELAGCYDPNKHNSYYDELLGRIESQIRRALKPINREYSNLTNAHELPF